MPAEGRKTHAIGRREQVTIKKGLTGDVAVKPHHQHRQLVHSAYPAHAVQFLI
jgi:hypothetical protein